MRQEFQEYSGFGELLCLVLAWTVGIVAVWSDYAGRGESAGGQRVAERGDDRGTNSFFE